MKSNITLIGMPGAGKSTTGIILAKHLSFGFLDTDALIQINRQKSLQQIIDETDYLNLRKIEEEEILKINIKHHVIATGGSAIYSEKAMAHLISLSNVIFLNITYEEVQKRIHNEKRRGIANARNQTLLELYDERQALYNKYAESTIACDHINQEEVTEKISECLTRS